MNMHVRIAAAALAGAACAAAWGQARTPQAAPAPVDRQARAWAATCSACHGTEGRPQAGFPLLAGRNADELYAALTDFREGRRPESTIMHQHTKGYSDEELQRIARHFSTLPMEAPKSRARR